MIFIKKHTAKMLLIILITISSSAILISCTSLLKAKNGIIEKSSQKVYTNKAVYFYVTSCSECSSVGSFFDILDSKYGIDFNSFQIEKLNVGEPKNLEDVKKYFKAYNVPEKEQKVPIVFIGKTYLSGEKAIKERFVDEIKKGSGLKTRNLMRESTSVSLDGYKTLGVFGAGIINGLNPCSISMLLFFLSLLLAKNTNILKLGLSFCIGKFAAYVLLGTLFFNIFNKINLSFLGSASKIILVIVVFFLIIFNLYDYFAAKSENYDKIRLQLPKGLKKLNHEWLKKIVKIRNIWLLIVISFVLGMVISVGEFLCTGQVYLATIIYMLQESKYFNFKALVYFLLYGFAFIIPLLILTYCVYKFKEMFEISEFVRKKMHIIKLINAIVFFIFGLAVFLWF